MRDSAGGRVPGREQRPRGRPISLCQVLRLLLGGGFGRFGTEAGCWLVLHLSGFLNSARSPVISCSLYD